MSLSCRADNFSEWYYAPDLSDILIESHLSDFLRDWLPQSRIKRAKVDAGVRESSRLGRRGKFERIGNRDRLEALKAKESQDFEKIWEFEYSSRGAGNWRWVDTMGLGQGVMRINDTQERPKNQRPPGEQKETVLISNVRL